MTSTIVRADNWPRPSWDFQDLDDSGAPLWNSDGTPAVMDLTGSAFVLTITGPGLRLVLTTEDDELDVDLTTDRLSWPITQAQAAKFPLGKPATYTIQRIIAGKYQTLKLDTFTGAAGPNGGGHATVLLTGPVGPTGDVTPEAEAAQAAAEAAAASVVASANTITALEADRARLSNEAGAPPFVVGSARSPRRDTLRDRDASAMGIFANDRRQMLGVDTLHDEITADVPIVAAGGVKLASGPPVTSHDAPSFEIVAGQRRIMAASGEPLVDLDATGLAVAVRATAAVPELTGGLWRMQGGGLIATPPADDLVVGIPRYQTIRYREPLFPETPVIIFADEEDADGLDVRVFQGIPCVCCVGSATYYAWYGDNINEEEIAGNYVILARRSGDTVTEIAYIKHPNPAARTLDPFLFLDDDGLMHLSVTVTSDVTGSHDFVYGVWSVPITDPLSPAPRFGQWRRPLPYGIAARPEKFGTRWLVPVDCRETGNSPLYDSAAADLGLIGKYLFEFIPRTGEFLQVNRWPAALANNSWQESAVIFMRDGTYVHSWRTATGPYIAVCPDGPEVPVEGAAWTSLGTDVESRHAKRITPNGRTIAAFCAGPDRTNATIKMWAPGKLPTAAADRTLLLSGTFAIPDVSYFNIDFDTSGNVVIVADNNRFISDGDMRIVEWRLNEDNLFAGSISANPTPFVVNIQEAP